MMLSGLKRMSNLTYNKMKNSLIKILGGCLGVILTFIAVAAICNTIGWLLWNWVMPAVFNLPTITWMQSLGLYLLIQFIFRININYNNIKKQ